MNLAAKMEEMACSGEIIIGEKTFQGKPETIGVDKRINLNLKNRKEPVICYRISKKLSKK